MTTVQRLLENKGHLVWSIAPDASVFEAVQLMADKRVGALMVVEQNALIGVISERDYAREIVLKDRGQPIRVTMNSGAEDNGTACETAGVRLDHAAHIAELLLNPLH